MDDGTVMHDVKTSSASAAAASAASSRIHCGGDELTT